MARSLVNRVRLLPSVTCSTSTLRTNPGRTETSSSPVFALGDSSGVNTAASFTVMMVDTTSADEQTLRFLRTGYRPSGEKTQLQSSVDPLSPYQAPGSFVETGERKYIFLLYSEPRNLRIRNLPQEGGAFDLDRFQTENNFKSPRAGITFRVNIGDGGDRQQPSESVPSQGSPTTTAVRTSPAPPNTTQLAPTSAVADLEPISTRLLAPSTSVPISIATSQLSAVPTVTSQIPTPSEGQSEAPSTPLVPVVSTVLASSASDPPSSLTSFLTTTSDVPASSALVEQPRASATTLEIATVSASSTTPASGATLVATSTRPSPALQTVNGAMGVKEAGLKLIFPVILVGSSLYL